MHFEGVDFTETNTDNNLFVLEYYFNNINEDQKNDLVNRLFETDQFRVFDDDIMEKLYYMDNIRQLFRYSDMHFETKTSLVDYMLDVISLGQGDIRSFEIIKEYIDYIDTNSIIEFVVVNDMTEVMLLFYQNGKLDGYTMHDIELLLTINNEQNRRNRRCDIFTAFVLLLPMGDVSVAFVLKHTTRSRDFLRLCDTCDFVTFCDIIQKLPVEVVQCMKTNSQFRNAFVDVKYNNLYVQSGTRTITKTCEHILQKTCPDVFREITKFL